MHPTGFFHGQQHHTLPVFVVEKISPVVTSCDSRPIPPAGHLLAADDVI